MMQVPIENLDSAIQLYTYDTAAVVNFSVSAGNPVMTECTLTSNADTQLPVSIPVTWDGLTGTIHLLCVFFLWRTWFL